jgi:DNA polymerase III epsilon subunit-like protein
VNATAFADRPVKPKPNADSAILFFDTETTGIPLWNDPSDDPRQPYVVEIACELWAGGAQIDAFHEIVNPGVPIPEEVVALHGITTEIAAEKGILPDDMLRTFFSLVGRAEFIVGHNVSFDVRMMRIQAARVTGEKWDRPIPTYCTMRSATNRCRILKENPRTHNDWKWPSLSEAVRHFFDEDHGDAHSALADCTAARRVFFHLMSLEN